MKIDVTMPFRDFEGESEFEVKRSKHKRLPSGEMEPVSDKDGNLVLIPVTFRTIARMILNSVHPDEKELRNTDIYERGALALRISEASLPVDLKAEEAALIKTLAGKCCKAGVLSTVYFKQLEDMIENAKEMEKPKGNGVAAETSAAG